ncbi:Protein PHLOEM PROTEIN 2-LIKE A10 [Ananas comosus]|uniref:Protein PHLOEM PROTEIN 2-LIKE A10 n=1 Tax=Ananas comosus TaxID=4615 RepID=A0A199VQ89_ANACO|nr:Protein PHLOEM PROTEIN 2-LIKE A10 [Ananas comosus]
MPLPLSSSRELVSAPSHPPPPPPPPPHPPMDRFVALSRRHRRWLLLLAAASAAGYGAYRIYHHPSVARSRRGIARLAGTLAAVADAAASSADAAALVSADVNSFLRSDADEVPASLRQIAKLARSEEFVGYGFGGEIEELGGSESASRSSFSDKLLDKLFSTAGSGFASVVAGSFARNLVIGFYTNGSEGGGGSSSSYSPDVSRWIEVICGDKCKEMIGNCIQIFVSTAVAVYLDKTMDINTYQELFAGLTNPKHESKMKDMLVTVCNGAVETLVKTSHHVVTVPNATSQRRGETNDMEEESKGSHDRISSDQSSKSGGGWVDTVSSTLAVPSNRKFVLDVTGRITFETVRSFLEFMLWKILDGARRGVNAVHEEVIGSVLEVARYISAKSMLVATICITLCMRVFTRTKVLTPA